MISIDSNGLAGSGENDLLLRRRPADDFLRAPFVIATSLPAVAMKKRACVRRIRPSPGASGCQRPSFFGAAISTWLAVGPGDHPGHRCVT